MTRERARRFGEGLRRRSKVKKEEEEEEEKVRTDLISVIFLRKCTFWAQFFST